MFLFMSEIILEGYPIEVAGAEREETVWRASC